MEQERDRVPSRYEEGSSRVDIQDGSIERSVVSRACVRESAVEDFVVIRHRVGQRLVGVLNQTMCLKCSERCG
jgi:hypothetical protein